MVGERRIASLGLAGGRTTFFLKLGHGSKRDSVIWRLAQVPRISRSGILPSQPLQRLLGLMLRFVRGANSDSVRVYDGSERRL